MEEVEVQRIAGFLSEVQKDVCKGDISPVQLTELYRVSDKIMDAAPCRTDRDMRFALATAMKQARRLRREIEQRLGMRN